MPAALLLAAGIALAAGDGLAPVGKGYQTTAGGTSLVLRPAQVAAGYAATWRLLLSDSQTDAPIQSAQVDLAVYGPSERAAQGSAPQTVRARAGSFPGHYLAELKQPPIGRYAAMVTVAGSGAAEPEVMAVDGIEVVAPPSEPITPRPPGLWYWGGVAALLLLGYLIRSRIGKAAVAASVALLVAAGARAHDTSNPGDRVPGSQEDLAQELQFALGVRTQPVAVLTFEAPAGSGLAPRQGPGVPRSAIVERDGKKLVFVRLSPERFAAREVRLGWRGPGDAVAVTSGLQPGELVVIAGGAFMRNGGGQLP